MRIMDRSGIYKSLTEVAKKYPVDEFIPRTAAVLTNVYAKFAGKITSALPRWRKNPGLASIPESRHKPGNGRSWSGYADILQGGIREAPITDALGEHPLRAQNVLQRWHHARHL
jgi:hypothetical protein